MVDRIEAVRFAHADMYGETDEGVLGATADHMKAIRFPRQWDAEKVLADIGWTEAFVCEHAWEHFTGERRPRVRPAPSGGHSPHATPVSPHEFVRDPSGTNLWGWDDAVAMVRHMVAEMPTTDH